MNEETTVVFGSELWANYRVFKFVHLLTTKKKKKKNFNLPMLYPTGFKHAIYFLYIYIHMERVYKL